MTDAAAPAGADRYFHTAMTVLVTAIAALTAYGLWATRVAVDWRQLLPVAGILVLLLALFAFYRWRQADRLSGTLIIVFWAVLYSNLHLLPMCVAARCRVPLRDARVIAFDRALGVEVGDVLAWMGSHPAIDRFLKVCYVLLLPLMTVAVIVPPMCRRMQTAKEYVLAGAVSAALCLPLFAVFQVLGPWDAYGYAPTAEQANYLRTFAAAKADEVFAFDVNYHEGLITFPSFHTTLAVLAAVALWPFPWLRWPAALLAGLIAVSTVTTGWHYVGDTCAGLAVAVVSVLISKGFTRLERRWLRQSERGIPSAGLAARRRA